MGENEYLAIRVERPSHSDALSGRVAPRSRHKAKVKLGPTGSFGTRFVAF